MSDDTVGNDRSADTLTTAIDGVVLRRYHADMVDALVAAADFEEISTYMGDGFPYPYTRDDAEAWIAVATADDPPIQYSIWVDGELAGGLGAFAGTDERTGTYEIGWWLTPARWGHGITSAAARRLVDELFEQRDVMRVWAPIMHPNAASARVAEHAGLLREGISFGAYLKRGVRYDQIHYGLTRPQWQVSR
ncbi:MAG: GNAT family protein [Acidimicrobiia bacterium]